MFSRFFSGGRVVPTPPPAQQQHQQQQLEVYNFGGPRLNDIVYGQPSYPGVQVTHYNPTVQSWSSGGFTYPAQAEVDRFTGGMFDGMREGFENRQIARFGMVLVPSQLASPGYNPPPLTHSQQLMADYYSSHINATLRSMLEAGYPGADQATLRLVLRAWYPGYSDDQLDSMLGPPAYY